MIILDTNVLSEVLRPAPEAAVLTWLTEQSRASVFTTAITRGEILYGVQLLPEGGRRDKLLGAVLSILNEDFAGRILSFDNDAADAYAEIAASRRAIGKPISQFDAQIAAMARSRGATLATRNVRDFTDCGIEVLNPWRE